MICKCGRPAVYLRTFGGNATEPGQLLPYCDACEYGPCATCDCAPDRRAQQTGVTAASAATDREAG